MSLTTALAQNRRQAQSGLVASIREAFGEPEYVGEPNGESAELLVVG